MAATPDEFASLMPDVVSRLLGEPNRHLSKADDIRYGSKGSLGVDISKGTYYDFEAKDGGGVLKLIQRERSCSMHEALCWLEDEGLKERSQFAEREPSVFYDYANETGAIAYRVERRGKGQVPPFVQHGPDGRGGFKAGKGCMQGVDRLPYRLPQLLSAPPSRVIHVCEGEKDADRLMALGLLATTNSGGAGNFTADLGKWFKDRQVVILADNDDAGAKHALDVSVKLSGFAERVAILDLPGLPSKGDVSDWLNRDGSVESLIELSNHALQAVTDVQREAKPIKATPFTWRAEADIPPREWIYGKHLLRQYVSVDIAAGGIGKSSLKIGEALAMASNQDLYGQTIHDGPYKVWLYNLEDPADETERRIHATAKRFNLNPEDFGDRLFADTGRDQPLIIAEELPTGVRINTPVVEALVSEIMERGIDVLVVDPFVSSHAVSENDNNKIDAVAKLWVKIAGRCNCSINLVHHIRKQNGQEANAESGRGAVALIGAARSVAVYNRMTKDEADHVGVPEDEARFYFRVENDKANLAPPEKATWYRMNNQDLDNGDQVGVACAWTAPDPFDGVTVRHTYQIQKAIGEGEWRENVQSKDKWVGVAVAAVLMLDIEQKRDRTRITSMLRTWIKNGVLEVVEKEDAKRMTRKFVVPGKWVEI